MNKKFAIFSLAALLATSLTANEVELQVVGGKNYADNDKTSVYNDADTLGARANFYFSKNNAFQLAYDELYDVTDDDNAYRFSANYYGILRDNGSKVHPFMLIGIGYEDGVNEGQGFVNGGIGASVELTKSVNLIGEIKGIKKNKDYDFDLNTNIGLGLMFGQEPENDVIKSDCVTEEVAPRLVHRRVFVPQQTVIVDDKINCVR